MPWICSIVKLETPIVFTLQIFWRSMSAFHVSTRLVSVSMSTEPFFVCGKRFFPGSVLLLNATGQWITTSLRSVAHRAAEQGKRTIEVKVVSADLTQRLIKLLLGQLLRVRRVPELRRDEELLPLDDGRDDLLERTPDLVLVLVD